MPLELEGFTAWIDSDGEEIACHGIELSENRNEVTCWIPSEEGKVRLSQATELFVYLKSRILSACVGILC